MRRTALTLGIVAAAGLAGAGFYGFVWGEEPLARGELVEALLQEADESKLTEVFARFVPVEAGFDRQAAVLIANGFRCGIRPANVEGSSYLTCDRPIEGTGYCRGFQFYSYRTDAGGIIDVLGSAFDGERHRNILGRCENFRQSFFALADDPGDLELAAEP